MLTLLPFFLVSSISFKYILSKSSHLKPKIITGLIYDYSNDNISYDYSLYDIDFRSLNLTHTFLGLSLIGYFTEFGNGGFYKFDIGRAALEYNFSVISDDDTNISKNGTGLGIGIGYSFYLEQFNKTRAFPERIINNEDPSSPCSTIF